MRVVAPQMAGSPSLWVSKLYRQVLRLDRVEWFQANAAELSSTEEDFTSPTDRWFVVVREQVVLT